MTSTDHDERPGSSAEEPREMPLPRDPNVIFLGGLFILAALVGAYLASEIVLPLVLAFILKLLLQPGVRTLEAAVCGAHACITAVDPIGIWNNRWVDRGNFGARERLGS